ncbi:MAG TPA: DUF456 domain-containing protein [Tepidisphaeraceae bacterium]|jgi:uncharacterized protein YqgC (DUF456 family)|nr:DUF456 domain-containing protein [Tepidisphaeraceae bacterium]
MHWLYYLLLIVVMVTGLLLNIAGLPGLWLMVAAFGGYALATGWDIYVGWPSLVTMIVLALIAEVVEFLAGAAGSKAAGARKRGMIGAVVGGFLGAIFLSIIPIPIVAQIFGACLGAFLGAMIMELTDKDVTHSLRVGVGAAKGRFMGILSKLAFGIIMLVIGAIAAIPIGAKRPAPLAPNVPPTQMIPAATTVPTTQLGSLDVASISPSILGTWRSSQSTQDHPEFETYSVDGTVVHSTWYEHEGNIDSRRTSTRNWRIQDNAVEIGAFNEAGTFIREEPPRPIHLDSAGKVVSIGDWSHATTQPASKP